MENREVSAVPAGVKRFGVLSLGAGVLAAVGVAMVGLTSFVPSFDPPGWIRIPVIALFPIGMLASFGLAVGALLARTGRVWAISGIAVSVLALAAFVVMIASVG